MPIYVSRAGETLGPFHIKQVKEMVESGSLLLMDLAWSETTDEWLPLYKVVGILPQRSLPALQPASVVPEHPKTLLTTSIGPRTTFEEYSESKTKHILKRAIGLFFIVCGIGIYILLKPTKPTAGIEQAFVWLLIVYFVAGGLWWASGNGEQCWVSLKARLSLIFALHLAVILPLAYVGATAHRESSMMAVDVRTIASCAIFALFGIPAIAFGHVARRNISNHSFLTGNGRAALSLCIGYLCLICLSADAFYTWGANGLRKTFSSERTQADRSIESTKGFSQNASTVEANGVDVDVKLRSLMERGFHLQQVESLPSIPARFLGTRFILATQEGSKPVFRYPLHMAPKITSKVTINGNSFGSKGKSFSLSHIYSGTKQGIIYVLAVNPSGECIAFWEANASLSSAFQGADCTIQIINGEGIENSFKMVLSAPEKP
jgi:hypothetical protein